MADESKPSQESESTEPKQKGAFPAPSSNSTPALPPASRPPSSSQVPLDSDLFPRYGDLGADVVALIGILDMVLGQEHR
jgi:hypothetical protein